MFGLLLGYASVDKQRGYTMKSFLINLSLNVLFYGCILGAFVFLYEGCRLLEVLQIIK